jgi:hypothetical protein
MASTESRGNKMEEKSKLKPLDEYGPVVGLIIGIIMIIGFVVIGKIYGEYTVDFVAGILLGLGGILNLIIWSRTKNIGHFSFMLWQVVMAVRLLFNFEDPVLVTVYRVVIVILVLFFLYMIYKKKLNNYYKNILELAAQPVESTEDGFTARPYPVGQTEYSPQEMSAFGKYCAKNLIAMPYREENKIILVLTIDKLKDIFWFRKNYAESTYISFDTNGKVEVNISKKDYKQYRDELTFDQLCSSLGNLFIEFLELFREDKSEYILTKLNQAGK